MLHIGIIIRLVIDDDLSSRGQLDLCQAPGRGIVIDLLLLCWILLCVWKVVVIVPLIPWVRFVYSPTVKAQDIVAGVIGVIREDIRVQAAALTTAILKPDLFQR